VANNPAGINQLGSHPYGAIRRATELTREAPMSGAPVATHATEAPRRAGKRAKRGAPVAAPPAALVGAPVGPEPSPQAQLAVIYSVWAAEPDASDLVRQLAKAV
jgi:hypothetical protein